MLAELLQLSFAGCSAQKDKLKTTKKPSIAVVCNGPDLTFQCNMGVLQT